MKEKPMSVRVWLPGLLCLALVCGCGGKSAKLMPVSGKVTVDGQPLTSGVVSLVPTEVPREEKTPGLSSGNIDSNGDYKIFTNGKEGAPAGAYKVVVAPAMMPMGDGTGKPALPFNQRYSDPRNTDLKYEVVASPSPGQYDLKLSR